MKIELPGHVSRWDHSPQTGCTVTVNVAGTSFKVQATPELVEAMRDRSTLTITIEAPPKKAKICACCGPVQ